MIIICLFQSLGVLKTMKNFKFLISFFIFHTATSIFCADALSRPVLLHDTLKELIDIKELSNINRISRSEKSWSIRKTSSISR